MVVGTTVTNVVRSYIAEMLVGWQWEGFTAAICRCIRFGTIVALPVAILSAAVWYGDPWRELSGPILALKHVYWLRTQRPADRAEACGDDLLRFLLRFARVQLADVDRGHRYA